MKIELAVSRMRALLGLAVLAVVMAVSFHSEARDVSSLNTDNSSIIEILENLDINFDNNKEEAKKPKVFVRIVNESNQLIYDGFLDADEYDPVLDVLIERSKFLVEEDNVRYYRYSE